MEGVPSNAAVPMFPLGSVVFPGMFVPLHVFEERFRRLIADCLDADRMFGSALIQRGSEVGGGDVRSDVAVRARIVEAEQFADGRWSVLAVGIDRVRVTRWLPDDPYPMAVVEESPDETVDPGFDRLLRRSAERLVSFMDRARSNGFQVPELAIDPGSDLPPDPTMASFQLAAISPMGPSDRYALLDAQGPTRRLEMFIEMIDEQSMLLDGRIQPPPPEGFGPDPG